MNLNIKKPIYSAIVFFFTLGILYISYGAYSTISKVGSGSGLTASSWNQMVDNLEDLNTRFARNGTSLYYNGGNVGIGTNSPIVKFQVRTASDHNLWVYDTPGAVRIGAGNDAGTISVPIYLTSDTWFSGNVGIGTINPINKLHVDGNIGATGRIGAGCESACEVSGGYAILYPDGRGVATTGWQTSSDIRLKYNIEKINNSLAKILTLNGVKYKLKAEKNNNEHLGLIAQDVEKNFPQIVSTNNNGYKSVDYDKLVAPIIEAIKEQQKQIELQNNKIIELEEKINK